MLHIPSRKLLGWLPLAAALALLPLRSDGGPAAQTPCANNTSSLASTLQSPVNGDEQFFTLPVGPSNVMFLVDTSGSMDQLPQCGDANNAWNDSAAPATCKWPALANPPNPAAGNSSIAGTCDLHANADLAWMHAYVPAATLVDPGHGLAANGLDDRPGWGTGCTGDNCLFRADRVYEYSSWGETSATSTSNGSFTISYADHNCPSRTSKTSYMTITPPAGAVSGCLLGASAPGFYFFNWEAAYPYKDGSCNDQVGTQSGTKVLFSGGWLNANPPKFMSARKVMKETVWIDPGHTAPTDQLRFGLTYTSTALTNNAQLVVPLGPSQANSYPVNPAKMVEARQYVLNALNRKFASGQSAPALANGGTPMASGLFRVGQYFTQPGTYTNAFGASYEIGAFAQTAIGSMKASWVDASYDSICWSCQKSAIIVVTDGSPNTEMGFPATINSYGAAAYALGGNCAGATNNCNPRTKNQCCSPSDTTGNPPSRLPRVAAWLHENDLRSDLNNAQNLFVHAVSFNLPPGNAQNILQATANMSEGTFNNAADGADLAARVAQAVAEVATSSTSFGAPAASALTTIHAANTKAFVTRFRPSEKATWEGHVFQFMLFDEAAAGCNTAKKFNADDPSQKVICRGKEVPSNFNGDTTPQGFNICSGTFLLDADCDEVLEEKETGLWFKKGSGHVRANVFWDAGQVLSAHKYPTGHPKAGLDVPGYTSAAEPDFTGNIAPVTKFAPGKRPRTLWTALPDGTMTELETRNASALAPYMNLTQSFCAGFEQLAKLCGSGNDAQGHPLPACPKTVSGDWRTSCAEQVILFARGWDVLDQDDDGCGGPGNPSNKVDNMLADGSKVNCAITSGYSGEERDRANDQGNKGAFYKLGDVFHSSPVLVHPPTSEGICQYGIDNQCVRTLFGRTSNDSYAGAYQTSLDLYASCATGKPQVGAYRAWRSSLKDRKSAVLVGSNDGFLHAFDAGIPDVGMPLDDDCVPGDLTDGTGEELWGLVPADLLPRLRDTMFNHQYMVDGNVMVRDVWLDGTNNGLGGSVSNDGKKQRGEFHTVAVVTERSGGTQYTALDLTDIATPKLLWTFPPPLSNDAQYMGESWSDFAPRPPPIGPVRLETKAGDPDPTHKGWLERWVVMVNGGYDPSLNRGRAVWMLDVGTGGVLWRYTDSDFKANLGFGRSTSMFPVPAAVGLVDMGDPAVTPFDSDNFFDTATWGDMGGNLFVARFDVPGKRDANGRVTNWKAARTFEQSRRGDDAQVATDRSELFYMTSNVYEPQRKALRTLIGSGNRERILATKKGCSPDDIFSCCQAGCAVTTGTTMAYDVCGSTGGFSCSGGRMYGEPLASTCGSGASSCASGSKDFTATASYSLDCGTFNATTAVGSATCDEDGLCSVSPVGTGHDLTPSGNTCYKSRFYGIWSYGGAAQKTFSTAPSEDWTRAKTFDENRFTDVDYDGCLFTSAHKCTLVDTTQVEVTLDGSYGCASGSCRPATVDDPGWQYWYNTGPCPTLAACASGCTGEKTASSATVTRSCGTWNSFLPLGSAATGTDPCTTAGTATQIAVGYASNFVSGAPDLSCNEAHNDTNILRGQQRSTIAPPSAPMVRYGLSPLGQVHYSALQFDPGQPPSSTSLGSRDVMESLYWLEVPRESHNIRHGP